MGKQTGVDVWETCISKNILSLYVIINPGQLFYFQAETKGTVHHLINHGIVLKHRRD